jgi:hypothetical protein
VKLSSSIGESSSQGTSDSYRPRKLSANATAAYGNALFRHGARKLSQSRFLHNFTTINVTSAQRRTKLQDANQREGPRSLLQLSCCRLQVASVEKKGSKFDNRQGGTGRAPIVEVGHERRRRCRPTRGKEKEKVVRGLRWSGPDLCPRIPCVEAMTVTLPSFVTGVASAPLSGVSEFERRQRQPYHCESRNGGGSCLNQNDLKS